MKKNESMIIPENISNLATHNSLIEVDLLLINPPQDFQVEKWHSNKKRSLV